MFTNIFVLSTSKLFIAVLGLSDHTFINDRDVRSGLPCQNVFVLQISSCFCDDTKGI